MLDQIKFIRETLTAAQNGLKWYRNEHPEDESEADDEMHEQIALAFEKLDELEQAMQEPVAFVHWPISGGPRLVWHSNRVMEDAILKCYEGHQPNLLLFAAAPAQQVDATQWQPIETAPKDGSWYLSWSTKEGYYACNQPSGCYAGVWHKSDGNWCGSATRGMYATHWTHLLAAPKESQ